MNKRLIALITTSAILIGACGSGTDTNNSNNNDRPRVTTSDIRDEQRAYLDFIAAEAPIDYLALSDDELIETGKVICESLDRGVTLGGLVQIAMDSGLSSNSISSFIGGAVMHLCPEHEESVGRGGELS